jgi:DNA polymerase-4
LSKSYNNNSNVIFHIDVNSAFLSWEAVYRLSILGAKQDLREIPSAVAGDIKMRSGIILAKSTPAKNYRIQTGEMISDALKKCPRLVLVPPHYNLYDSCSKSFMEILRRYSPDVEQYSVDEAYVDMTNVIPLHSSPVLLANELKDTIFHELGFTVNVGVSSNKLLAKMAGDFKKPNLVHTCFPAEVKEKLWPLPVSELFYVGRATTKKLFALGIKTIGELANTDLSILKAHFKKHGELIYLFANGIDITDVISAPPPNKGYGNSKTIAFDVTDIITSELILLSLCETISARLRSDNVKISCVSVSIVYSDFSHISHQCLITPTNITNELHKASCRLFHSLWCNMPIRNLGVHTSKVTEDDGIQQLDLFQSDRLVRLATVEKTIDKIRLKYGDDSIMRGSFLNTPIRHMTGGISIEKKTVDYERIKIE